MNSIEWLIEEMMSKGFFKESVTLTNIDHLQYKAEELHKQEMGDTWDAAIFRNAQRGYNASRTFEDFDDYYQETFVSKGSDDTFKVWECCGMEECICKHPSVISENGNELLFDKEGNLIKELPKQETLYTEEQVMEAIQKARHSYAVSNDIILSLKQPKKD
jgi:hypothetical protein